MHVRTVMSRKVHTTSCCRRGRPKNNQVHLHSRLILGVVVPVFAKSQGDIIRLIQALDKIAKQTRQPDFLVLVDDGSPVIVPDMIRSSPPPPPPLNKHSSTPFLTTPSHINLY